MAIVSSQIIARRAQKVGERITEKHTDSLGAVYYFDYVIKSGDPSLNLPVRAAWLENELAAIEEQRLINGS